MLWKILSGLSAVALGVGLWFSYQNQGALKEERVLKDRAEQNLKSVKQVQEKAAEAKDKKTKELADLTKQREDITEEVTNTNGTIEQLHKEVETKKTVLAEAQAQLAKLNKDIIAAGDIKKLLAQVDDLTKQAKDSEAAIANQEQQLALAQEKVTGTTSQIVKLKEVDSRQMRGQVEPTFNARVTQPYPEFGFVVLNKGNLGGVFANALLNVKRGKNIIARLKVRNVEQGMSVADLIPGSLANGESIRSGDLVVAAAIPPPPVAPTAPAAHVVPAGGMAAPTMGTPAPGAPASGTPPPASADPFATPAPPAGAAPAQPVAEDPFAK
jgi:ABC-type transporter Mla subunit MlaD